MKRKKHDDRLAEIIAAGVKLAERVGYMAVTRNALAAAVGISGPAVSYHGTVRELRTAIVKEAIRTECLPVIAQAITMRHPLASQVPRRLRLHALRS